MKELFAALENLAYLCHENARRSGFWEEQDRLEDLVRGVAPDLAPYLNQLTVGLKCALITTETSELLEGARHGNPSDQHCPEFSSEEVEGADQIIRILDLAIRRGWRIGAAMEAKMLYNSTRPRKHGKLS